VFQKPTNTKPETVICNKRKDYIYKKILRMPRILSVIILTFIFNGCCSTDSKEFEFENNEPKHLSCYKSGDTIYFENSDNDIDTIAILSVDSAKGEKCIGLIAPRPVGKSCWVTIKHLPIDKWHRVTTTGKDNDTASFDYQTLIYITKDPIKNQTFFDFNFKDFYTATWTVLGKLKTDTLILNRKRITNYYVINHGFPIRVKDSTNIETLIWTDQHGLTAYKNKNGVWWIKK
jgi:hypothetical protein